MNICMIVPSLYPISIGGPANVTSHLIRELDRCGFKLKIIFEMPYNERTKIRLLSNQIGDNSKLFPIRLSSDWGFRIAAAPSALSQIIKKIYGVDIVHFQTYPSALPYFFVLLFIKARKIPCVLSYHGSIFLKIREPGETRTLQEYLHLPYLLITRKLFDIIIVPSFSMARRAELEGFKIDKIRVIPNGIDIDKFRKAKPVKLEGDPAILWVGYTGWKKGVDIALKAMRIILDDIPSARLHFIGPYHAGFIEELRREKLEGFVKVHGCISPLEMPSYYKGADICINPSRWESFSLVVLEAMAAGKPVIASRVGGMKELINDGVNGLLTRPEAHSFAKAIVRLYKDIDLRMRLAENARIRAEEFDWLNMVDYYLCLYSELDRK
ncbi:MAG: glycosyltransferase family 4 protein [Nitrososphaerales archaeon]